MHTPKKYGNDLKLEIVVNIMTCMFKVIHYCLQMFLKNLTNDKCIEIYGLDLSHFLSAPGLA